MKKRLLSSILALTLTGAMLTGCGGSQTPAPAAETTAEPADEKVTLSIYTQYADDDTKVPYDYAVEQLAKDYPNVELNLIVQAQDDGQTLKTLAATGQLPDIYQASTDIINTFRSSNQVMILNDVAKSTGYLDKNYNANRELAYADDGNIYAFPFSGQEYVLWYYNKAIFEEYGLEVPHTFDDLLNIIEVLKSHDMEDKGNYVSLSDIYRLNNDIESLKLQDAIEAIGSIDNGRAGMILLSSAVSTLMTNVINSGLPIENIFGTGFTTENIFDKTGSIEEAKEKVIELYRKRIEYETGKGLPPRSKASDVAGAVRKYIDANYSNYEMSMADISSELGVNQTYLRKMFKSETGMTLTEYITKTRLETARKIITETGACLTEVAETVGFSDASYFSKVFKKYYGVSPSHIKDSSGSCCN